MSFSLHTSFAFSFSTFTFRSVLPFSTYFTYFSYTSFNLQGLPNKEETCVEILGFIKTQEDIVHKCTLFFTGQAGTLFYDYMRSFELTECRILFRINDEENLCQGWSWGQVSDYLRTELKVTKKIVLSPEFSNRKVLFFNNSQFYSQYSYSFLFIAFLYQVQALLDLQRDIPILPFPVDEDDQDFDANHVNWALPPPTPLPLPTTQILSEDERRRELRASRLELFKTRQIGG